MRGLPRAIDHARARVGVKPSRTTVKFSMVKGRLVMTFTADDGGRKSVFTINETGDRLTLSVTITSERLTNPLKYALSDKRD
jgi:hypothetical protein